VGTGTSQEKHHQMLMLLHRWLRTRVAAFGQNLGHSTDVLRRLQQLVTHYASAVAAVSWACAAAPGLPLGLTEQRPGQGNRRSREPAPVPDTCGWSCNTHAT
jgi:hypothetical protein